MTQTLSYKAAGVDVEAGDAFVSRIAPLAKATARLGSMDGLGGFSGFFDLSALNYKKPVLLSATDGVGTKLLVAKAMGQYHGIGVDAVAMCVNDLLVHGGEPLFFLDYLATGKLEPDTLTAIVAGIADACQEVGCALIGGETAEMPGLYGHGDFDIAGFALGVVEKEGIITGKTIVPGDMIVGLPSSGLHANGFSLVRAIVEREGLSYHDPAPFDPDQSLGQALLTPTKLYVKPVLDLLKTIPVKGMVHITGGGFHGNIPRIVPETCTAVLRHGTWEVPAVFDWLRARGNLSEDEMHTTFNAGLGYILIVAPEHIEATLNALPEATLVGKIIPRDGPAVWVQ